MIKFAAAFLFTFITTTAQAASGSALTGSEITALLSGRSLYTDTAEQIFQKQGLTFFIEQGNVSQGTWRVLGDQYCSVWPPNPAEACYAVWRDGGTITFIAKSGNAYPMRLAK